MNTYLNEEQQVEALKQWWKDNGKSVVIGVVLGLSAIFGWKGWQAYRVAQGEAASSLYIGMQNQVAAGQVDNALEIGKRLLGEHTGSVYASYAALQLAQLMYQRGDKDTAAENLQWVVEHAPDPLLSDLARVRLARVRIDQKQYPKATTVLGQVDAAFMPGTVAELQGDIARAGGRLDEARKAYERAIGAGATGTLVRRKLLELGKGEKAS